MRTELINVKSTVRVESGRARMKAVATSEMEPDRTEGGELLAPNSQTRRVVLKAGAKLAAHYKLGFVDAMGKMIVEGEEFTYLGYFDVPVWYVYQFGPSAMMPDGSVITLDDAIDKALPDATSTEDVAGAVMARIKAIKKGAGDRYVPIDVKPTKDEALAVAEALEEK